METKFWAVLGIQLRPFTPDSNTLTTVELCIPRAQVTKLQASVNIEIACSFNILIYVLKRGKNGLSCSTRIMFFCICR